nr:hypothetical protein [Tatlockia sp.]
MLYEKIQKQLIKSGLKFEIADLQQTQILEYMVLEAAGLLVPFKNTPLVCSYKSSYSSEYSFNDTDLRSTINLNLQGVELDFGSWSIEEPEREKFINLASSIQHKFPKSMTGHSFSVLYEIIMRDKDLLKAIKSSSLYIAAGELSSLDLTGLLLLKQKVELYKNVGASIADKPSIADTLITKINLHLNKKYSVEQINEAEPTSQKQFTAYQALLEQERVFNQLFIKLQGKITELSSKGREFITF